jgi:hypothetical protein
MYYFLRLNLTDAGTLADHGNANVRFVSASDSANYRQFYRLGPTLNVVACIAGFLLQK